MAATATGDTIIAATSIQQILETGPGRWAARAAGPPPALDERLGMSVEITN